MESPDPAKAAQSLRTQAQAREAEDEDDEEADVVEPLGVDLIKKGSLAGRCVARPRNVWPYWAPLKGPLKGPFKGIFMRLLFDLFNTINIEP